MTLKSPLAEPEREQSVYLLEYKHLDPGQVHAVRDGMEQLLRMGENTTPDRVPAQIKDSWEDWAKTAFIHNVPVLDSCRQACDAVKGFYADPEHKGVVLGIELPQDLVEVQIQDAETFVKGDALERALHNMGFSDSQGFAAGLCLFVYHPPVYALHKGLVPPNTPIIGLDNKQLHDISLSYVGDANRNLMEVHAAASQTGQMDEFQRLLTVFQDVSIKSLPDEREISEVASRFSDEETIQRARGALTNITEFWRLASVRSMKTAGIIRDSGKDVLAVVGDFHGPEIRSALEDKPNINVVQL